MLSDDELADLQADFAALLDLRADVVRLADVAGVMTPTTIATNVRMGVMPAHEVLWRQYGGDDLTGRQLALLSFPARQDVRRDDRIEQAGGPTWVVVAVVPPGPNSNSAYRQCLAYFQTMLQVEV